MRVIAKLLVMFLMIFISFSVQVLVFTSSYHDLRLKIGVMLESSFETVPSDSCDSSGRCVKFTAYY